MSSAIPVSVVAAFTSANAAAEDWIPRRCESLTRAVAHILGRRHRLPHSGDANVRFIQMVFVVISVSLLA